MNRDLHRLVFFIFVSWSFNTILSASINPYFLKDFSDYIPRNGSHDLILGRKSTDDRMLFHMRFLKKNSTEKEFIAKSDIHYPSTGVLRNKNISYLEIFDMMSDGHGGYAKIIDGGPGERNVTIRLQSQPGYGFDFLIKIYGLDFMYY